jgi:hypothetical protein
VHESIENKVRKHDQSNDDEYTPGLKNHMPARSENRQSQPTAAEPADHANREM